MAFHSFALYPCALRVLTIWNICSIIGMTRGGESRFHRWEWPPCMAQDRKYQPFDPLLGQGLVIPYRPRWNQLTGSPLGSILLQQILFHWHGNGRKPFPKYTAPCARSQPGRTWVEELGITRKQFELARARIATKVTTGDSAREIRSTSLVIYYTRADRRTWYEVNEGLLVRRLLELENKICGPAAGVSSEAVRRPDDGRALERDTNGPQGEKGHCLSNAGEGRQGSIGGKGDYITNGQKGNYMLMAQVANTCTNKENKREQTENVNGDAERVWAMCLADLRLQMSRETFFSWLHGTRALDMADGTLRVAVKNEYAKDWLDYRLRSTIEKTLRSIAGDRSVEFIVSP
jgi:hypothetical protein